MSDPQAASRHAPFEKGNLVALRHGATSDARIRPAARNHRRRLLRQIGLRSRDLDPLGRAHLDLFCRLSAKIELADRYLAEHGMIRDDGEPQPILKVYVSLANSTRLALARLEQHVQARTTDSLGDYLEHAYGAAEDAEIVEGDGA